MYIVGRKLFSPTSQAFLLFLQLFRRYLFMDFFMIKPPQMIGTVSLFRKGELMAHLFVIQENKDIASIWGKW